MRIIILINGDLIYLKPEKPRVAIGDKVRISKYKRQVFNKGYTPKWTEEIFVVDKVLPSTKPVTHKIVDLTGETIEGTFFRARVTLKRQNKEPLELKKF